MPCSCGSTTCPCGIPCYCSDELCKCHDCAIALHRFCKICYKQLFSDMRTDEDTCSCFIGESTALIFENQDYPQYRIGNLPMPLGYFMYGKLIVNVMIPIPVMRLPQFIPQPPMCFMPPSTIQADSERILTSLTSAPNVATPIPHRENYIIPSTGEYHQLDRSSGLSTNLTSSGICSFGSQNAEMSSNETCHSFVSQSRDESQTANMQQSSNSEIEGDAIAQELSSFYLPSIRIDNITYPVRLADPVWRLPNPAFCINGRAASSLKLHNPFYVAGIVNTTQIGTFDKEYCEPASSLNFISDDLAQANDFTTLQMNEQLLDMTKIKQSNSKIYGGGMEFEASFSGISNDFSLNEQHTFNSFPSNEIQENYSMHYDDKTISTVSTDISSFRMQGLFGAPSQPQYSVPTSVFGENNYPQFCSDSRPQVPSTTQVIPEYVGATNTSKFLKIMENNAQSSEGKYPQSGNPSSGLGNEKINKETEFISLYIDNFTIQKMEKLLKSA